MYEDHWEGPTYTVKIIDNFLDKTYFKSLQDNILGSQFPWFISPLTYEEEDSEKQLVHMAYKEHKPHSNLYDNLIPCLNKLKVFSIFRIKANLLPRSDKRIIYDFHIDIGESPFNYKTAILYMNTNNGVTIFKDSGEEIKSVENRMIIFPGDSQHAGTTNTDKDIPLRCLINFCYL